MDKIITKENCDDVCKELESDGGLSTGKIGAWRTVHYFCCQNGMDNHTGKSGIESVIIFIQSLIDNQKVLS